MSVSYTHLILKDDEENVDIIVSDRTVLFDFGYYQVYSRLLDGEFLKYDAIISVVNTLNVVVEKSLITDSLERALLLINDDISVSYTHLARNLTVFAISSGLPSRSSDVSSQRQSKSSFVKWLFISVSITPGATQFTHIPDGPNSFASAFVKPITAAFAAL